MNQKEKDEYRTLNEALHGAAHGHPWKKLEAIAEELGVSRSYLTRACLPSEEEGGSSSGCRFPAHLLTAFCRATESFKPLDFIERSLGRVAFTLPKSTQDHRFESVAHAAMHAAADFGRTVQAIEEAHAPESPGGINLTKHERDTIMAAGHHFLQDFMVMLAMVERG